MVRGIVAGADYSYSVVELNSLSLTHAVVWYFVIYSGISRYFMMYCGILWYIIYTQTALIRHEYDSSQF